MNEIKMLYEATFDEFAATITVERDVGAILLPLWRTRSYGKKNC